MKLDSIISIGCLILLSISFIMVFGVSAYVILFSNCGILCWIITFVITIATLGLSIASIQVLLEQFGKVLK